MTVKSRSSVAAEYLQQCRAACPSPADLKRYGVKVVPDALVVKKRRGRPPTKNKI